MQERDYGQAARPALRPAGGYLYSERMINVQKKDENHFTVTVSEGGSETTHQVELDDDYYHKVSDGSISKADLVRRSFEFLLARESKESILGRFHLSVIARYFPEYESEIGSM
jgi:hypothetical protein